MSVIQKLRIKFVAINMAIVTVMLIIMGTFFVVSVTDGLKNDSMTLLSRVINEDRQSAWSMGKPGHSDISLPYFTVRLRVDGTYYVTSSQFYVLSDEAVEAVVEECLDQEAATGILEDYSLRYLRKAELTGWRIAFADISQERRTAENTLKTTLIVSFSAFLLFFLISILLARWAVRPVEESWKKQRQFVADASHELKTPLTVILSNVELLERYGAGLSAKDRQRLENLHFSASQMRELVEELLILARSDNGTTKRLPHVPLDLSELVEDAALQFDAVVFESGHTLTTELAPDLKVTGEEGQLRRLVDILLDNARKYGSEGGEIRVTLAAEGTKRVRLTVANDGVPIPKDRLESIFERFVRSDEARSTEGFGLGLPIARSIVQEHGGKIWAEAGEQENRFVVTLNRIAG